MYQICKGKITSSVGKDGFAHEIYNVGKMETAPFPKANHSSVKSAQPEVDNRTYPQKTQHGSTADRNDAVDTLPQQNSIDNSKSGQIPLSDTAAKAYRALTNIAASMPEGSGAKVAASGITAQAPSLSGLGVLAEALHTDTSLSPREKTLIVDSFAQGIADHLQSLGDGNISRSAGYAIAETLLNPTAKLTAEQRDALLASPHALQAMESVAHDMAATKNAVADKKTGKVQTGGKVDASAIAGETLDEHQKAAIDALKLISQATGVNFIVFASQVDEQGRYVGENGSYDPATHTVRIDIHAGRNSVKDLSQYALLRTVSHELTHFIQQEGGEEYQQLKDFFAAEFKKHGTSMAELVQNKLEENAAAVARLREQGYTDEQLADRQMDEKQAEAEVIADASEMMLKDSQAIARLAAQNESIFFRLKSFLLKLFAKMNKAFEKVSAASKEARLLKQYTAELQTVWDHALENATKNLQDKDVFRKQAENNQTSSEIGSSLIENGENQSDFLSAEDDVQFSDRGSKDPEVMSIKEQIKAALPELEQMDPVDHFTVYKNLSSDTTPLEWTMKVLMKTGYQVDRENFGVIEFPENQIKKSLKYLNTPEELFAFQALPKVLKQGIIRGSHKNHKNRGFSTFTIMAPVVMNEKTTGYMGVVVKREKKNLYKTHRIVLPDEQSLVYAPTKKEEPTTIMPHPHERKGKLDKSISSPKKKIAETTEQNNGKSGQKENLSDRVDLKYDLEDAMASLAEDVASGQHDSLLLSGDNKAELRAYGTDVAKLTSLQEKLQDQHEIMKDEHASKDEKIAARNRANMYQEQIAKLQERMQQVLQNPELKAEAESRMETAARLLGKMTKAELQQEVISLRERVNQLKRSYAARADSSTRQELRKAQAKLEFLESKHAQQLLDQKAEMQQRINQEKTMNKQRIERDKLRSKIVKSVKKLNDLMVHETDYKHVPEAYDSISHDHNRVKQNSISKSLLLLTSRMI